MEYGSILNKIAGADEKQNSLKSKAKGAVQRMAEKSSLNLEKEIRAKANPYLKADGTARFSQTVNQALLDNSNVQQQAKKMIMDASGLQPNVIQKNEIPMQEIEQKPSEKKLGFISAKYETSGSGAGTISTVPGDLGGTSYGTYMMTTNTGTANQFVNWLKKNNPTLSAAFGDLKAGTNGFNKAWTDTYNQYGETFSDAQNTYIYETIVQPLMNLAKEKTGIDYNRSPALKELIFSTAVQFGGGNLGLSALGNVRAGMSDKEIVDASYDKKIGNYKNYFVSSSPSVQEAVKNRFINERQDVLALLGGENTEKWQNPLAGYNISSAYGMRVHPVYGTRKMHNGIDIAAPSGTGVQAASGGTVLSARDSGDGYGITVYIDNGNGVVTRYSHLKSANVSAGQKVGGGETIGAVGSTGTATGPHLDFGVLVDGKYVNPLDYIQK